MPSYSIHLGFNWTSPALGTQLGITAQGPGNHQIQLYPLQIQVTDSANTPVFYRFAEGDTLDLYVWDVTVQETGGSYTPSDTAVIQVQVGFINPVTGTGADPLTNPGIVSGGVGTTSAAKDAGNGDDDDDGKILIWSSNLTAAPNPPAGVKCPWGAFACVQVFVPGESNPSLTFLAPQDGSVEGTSASQGKVTTTETTMTAITYESGNGDTTSTSTMVLAAYEMSLGAQISIGPAAGDTRWFIVDPEVIIGSTPIIT